MHVELQIRHQTHALIEGEKAPDLETGAVLSPLLNHSGLLLWSIRDRLEASLADDYVTTIVAHRSAKPPSIICPDAMA